MPDDRLGDVGEAPAGDPRPHVEVDVLVEGEVALVVAAELGEQLAPQQAGGAADAEDLVRSRQPRRLRLPRPDLEGAAVGGQRLAGAVEAGGCRARGEPPSPPCSSCRIRGCTPPRLGSASSASQQPSSATGLERRVGVEGEDRAAPIPGRRRG